MRYCIFKFTNNWWDHNFRAVGSHRVSCPASWPNGKPGTVEHVDYKCECGAKYSQERLYSWRPTAIGGK